MVQGGSNQTLDTMLDFNIELNSSLQNLIYIFTDNNIVN